MDFKTQSQILLDEYKAVFDQFDDNQLDEMTKLIDCHERIFFIGVGREGMATKAFAMRLMHMNKEVHWIWDDTAPGVGKGDLLIATSGCGDIGHIHYVCEQAKAAGCDLVIVTGSPSGKTAQMADYTMFIPAAVYKGKDKVVPSVQPMGNLFEQCLLIIFDILVMKIVDENEEITFEKMSQRHRNVE